MITIQLDPADFLAELDDFSRRQMPYATARALNALALEAQEAIQQRIFQRGFTVRSSATARWLSKSVQIAGGDRATKDKPVAIVRIAPPGKGSGRGALLSFLEEGGVRFSRYAIGSGRVFGPSSIAIPLRSPRTQQIPRMLYPTMTGLQERRAINGSLTSGALRGKRRTFAVRTGPQRGLVLQRTGPGPRDVKALFVIKPQAQVRGRQFFHSTAERIARERFAPHFAKAFTEAMRTAR